MALYELRTYTLYVGKMSEAVKLYQEFGFPALDKGGHAKNLVGYFQGDTGTINQLVHLWKFTDDAHRRAHWAAVFADPAFMDGFAAKFRPLTPPRTMGQVATKKPPATHDNAMPCLGAAKGKQKYSFSMYPLAWTMAVAVCSPSHRACPPSVSANQSEIRSRP